MDEAQREFIRQVLDHGTDLTLATIRPDGYPQATTVSFACSDMTLYVGIGRGRCRSSTLGAHLSDRSRSPCGRFRQHPGDLAERIGDRVTNIAEDVVFLATGEHEDLNP